MGNANSEVSQNVKSQAEADPSQFRIYSLLNVKKKGVLFDIVRHAMKTGNYEDVDSKIRAAVLPFLYNEGKGKKVPLSTLIRLRNTDRPADKRLPPPDGSNECDLPPPDSRNSSINSLRKFLRRSYKVSGDNKRICEFREVCWSIEERGSVGETALHICFLVPSIISSEIARRLVRLFPKIVNDVYLGDEYYGEAPLHMAIVNEDISLVKLFLDNGADVHKRAIGKFFCPDDVKDIRIDNINHEWYDIPIQTNFFGHVYMGEYPLTFAACLELDHFYRLLLAKGADPNAKDTFGNTVLHITVICDKLNMFNLAYELGADLRVRNKYNLSPLALAAKMTRAQLFANILKLERDVFWQFCDIAFAAYPIEEVDSIDVENGDVNKTSVLSVVVFGDELGHLDLFDGLLVEILEAKWNTFARKRFFKNIRLFMIYFLITFVSFLMRSSPRIESGDDFQPRSNCLKKSAEISNFIPSNTTLIDNCSESSCIVSLNENSYQNLYNAEDAKLVIKNDSVIDHCYLLSIESINDKICRVSEVLTVIGSILYLISVLKEYRNLGKRIFMDTLLIEPGRVMFFASCVLVLICIPFRVTCNPQNEDRVVSVIMFLTPMHFLFFCRGFKAVGPFVVMIYRMIVRDLLCFVVIYMIFVMGFAEAFYVIFLSHKGNGTNYFSGVTDSILSMFLMSLNEFADIYNEFDKTDHPYLAKFLFINYMILASVLLIAMLIAMMGKTYQDIASRPKEWLRQWARIVLIVERGLSRKQRLEFQKKYTQIRDGKSVFIVKWETNEEERMEIQRFKTMKARNARVVIRRQESLSMSMSMSIAN